jgi:glycosyltransferase involved in cell wall biosynthesis
MLPTITIVTPSYNQGEFIEEAMCSVLSQNYPRLQYILMDGGSTDCSRDIIARYSHKLDYWISEKDRGQSDALRKGFSRATGDLLGWLNSDDILYPDALQRVGEAYERSPECIIAGNTAVFVEGKPNKSRIIQQRRLNVHDMVAIWTGKSSYSQPGVFFPRYAYIQSDGIDETLHQCMDHDLMIRMLRTCPVAYVDEIIAGARLHPRSKTCSQAGAQIAEAYQVSQRYWAELPYPAIACRLFSVLGLGRCALGRLYHWNPTTLRPVILEMMNVAMGRGWERERV